MRDNMNIESTKVFSRLPNKYTIHVWHSGRRDMNILDIRCGATRVLVKDDVTQEYSDLTDADAIALVYDLSWHLYCRGRIGRPEFRSIDD